MTMKNKIDKNGVEANQFSEVDIGLSFDETNKNYAIDFVMDDVWDTYNDLVSKKWCDLTPKQKRSVQSINNFLENKNFAICILNTTYSSALKTLEQMDLMEKDLIEEYKNKQKDLKLLTRNDII